MKRIAIVAALVAVALAGCVDPPQAEEHLTVSIRDVGGSGYVLVMPLWLSDDGPSADEWVHPMNATIHSGQVTRFHLEQTEQGVGVLIAGNGTVSIGFEDVQSLTGSAFAHGATSLGTDADGNPLLWMQQGDVDLNWIYEANSEDCFTTASYWWQGAGPQWLAAEFGGRTSHSPDCPV